MGRRAEIAYGRRILRKCKAKKEIVDAVEEVMKNGRKAIKGKCPTCGTVMFKILGGKATPRRRACGNADPCESAGLSKLCRNNWRTSSSRHIPFRSPAPDSCSLITRTGLELVGARMFAPSTELVQKYSEAIVSANDPQDRRIGIDSRLHHPEPFRLIPRRSGGGAR